MHRQSITEQSWGVKLIVTAAYFLYLFSFLILQEISLYDYSHSHTSMVYIRKITTAR